MEHADVVSLLKSRGEPEDKILLDDGEYFIKHNVNCSLTSGNGFLIRRCEIGRRFPGGEEAVGGYDLKLDGKWLVDICKPWDDETETDSILLGKFDDRHDAIATLWLARHQAFCKSS